MNTRCTMLLLGALLALATGLPAPAAAGSVERIAFTYCDFSQNPIRCAIVITDADGANPLAVAEGQDAAWSPDGSRIAFSRASDHCDEDDCYSASAIFVLNLRDATVAPDITRSGGQTFDASPAWSPAGSKIVFGRNCAALYAIDADGSGMTLVADFANVLFAVGEPAWSPDGSTIAFTCMRQEDYGDLGSGFDYDVCRINADGSGFAQLTPGFDGSSWDWAEAAWSPDGTRIALTSLHSDSGFDISIMNADGTGLTRLTAGRSALAPAWSTDGARIAFEAPCEGPFSGIWLMNADGTDQRCVIGSAGARAWLRGPAWMPGTLTRASAPPVITHTPVTDAALGAPIVVSATITSAAGVTSATLAYRFSVCGQVEGGDACYTTVPLAANGAVYTGAIPPEAVNTTNGDLDYYLDARDVEGNVSRTPMAAPFIPYRILVPAFEWVEVTPLGSGPGITVTSRPAGIACGSTCAAAFVSGTTVTLSVTTAPGAVFTGWSGGEGGCSGAGACTFTVERRGMRLVPTFTASFLSLGVTKLGAGTGTVTSDPPGIDCGGACSVSYLKDTTVTLRAQANPGSLFGGWSGGCTGKGSCTMTLATNRSVTASFVPQPIARLSAHCTLPPGEVGAPYSASCTVAGGVPPYSCSVASGHPPLGLALVDNCSVTGTPTAPGAAAFTVSVTDLAGSALNAKSMLSIVRGLAITTTSLPPAAVNDWYSRMLVAANGQRPYAWSVIDGALPDGVILTRLGLLTGQLITTGVSTFTVQVEDTLGGHAQRALQIVGNLGPLRATCAPGPAEVGVAYGGACSLSGGLPPYTCALASGTPPASLTLNGDCTITGTPTAAGTRTFSVTVADSGGLSSSVGGRVTVLQHLAVSSTGLPKQAANRSFVTQLHASGGRPPYRPWAIVGGVLPSGVKLNAALGQLIGTPTTLGISAFTVRVTDALGGTSDKPLELIVNLGPLMARCDGGPAEVGVGYRGGCTARGGLPPYSCAPVSGTPSAGLTLAGDCSVTGTPTTTGPSPFMTRVTESGGLSQIVGGNVIVLPPVRITTPGLPTGHVKSAYGARLLASGGKTPLTWSIAEGTLAAGLALNPATGVITGRPTAPSSTAMTFRVTDVLGGVSDKTLTLTID